MSSKDGQPVTHPSQRHVFIISQKTDIPLTSDFSPTEAQEVLNDSIFIMTSGCRGNSIVSRKSSLLTEVRDEGAPIVHELEENRQKCPF